MTPFAIRLFGELEMSRSGTALLPPSSRSARHLFAFLLVNRGHPVARDKLSGTLWGDGSQDQARKALRNSLWRIRTLLAELGEEGRIRADRDHVHLAPGDDWWVDVWAFENELAGMLESGVEIRDAAHAARVGEAVDLHRRPFLEGEEPFWCETQRARLRMTWLAGLERLVAWERAREEWSAALLRAHTALRADPLREPMHREVMFCHNARGDRPSALAQFERLSEVLRDELGIAPMAETRELRHRILTGMLVPDPHALTDGDVRPESG